MAHLQFRHLTAGHPHVGRLRKRRDRKLRPIRPSHRNELAYRAELQAIVRDLRAAGDDIASRVRPDWVRRGLDSAEVVVALDETAPGLASALQHATAKLSGRVANAARLASEMARRNQTEVDVRLKRVVQQSVDVSIAPLLRPDSRLAQAMTKATEDNVALIKSMPTEYLADIQSTVSEGWQSGLRWEEVAKKIAAKGNVAENRAWVIARDQTSKMNAAFNEARQRDIGIEEYDWSGTLDVRERPSHRRMEGSRHRWDAPPLVDGEHVHPGEAILCRCLARPVFHLDLGATAAGVAELEAA